MNVNLIDKYEISDSYLSPHLKHSEFKCKCTKITCHFTLYSDSLLMCFEKAREVLGVPLIVTSGFRCQGHNKDIGGTQKSFHTRGMAVDIVCPSNIEWETFSRVMKSTFPRTLEYKEKNFIHCMTLLY